MKDVTKMKKISIRLQRIFYKSRREQQSFQPTGKHIIIDSFPFSQIASYLVSDDDQFLSESMFSVFHTFL